MSTGGVSIGGVATGGVSTGGVATGGVSTGGVSTGGVATGGVSTGGVSTGGAATGGAPIGGPFCPTKLGALMKARRIARATSTLGLTLRKYPGKILFVMVSPPAFIPVLIYHLPCQIHRQF